MIYFIIFAQAEYFYRWLSDLVEAMALIASICY
jgi:hypothetical protein